MASSDLDRAVRQAKRRGASPRKLKALVEAALVESGGRHITGGDRDSTGILQQRPSQGWGPVGESVEKDVDQFLAHADKADTGKGSAGQLAQRVQRSAFPAKYDQRSGDAERILGGAKGGGRSARAASTTTTTRDVEGFDEAGYESAQKKQVLAQLLSRRHGGKGSVLLRTGAISTAPVDKEQYATTRQVTDTKTTPSSSAAVDGVSEGDGSAAKRFIDRANVADRANNAGKLDYKWGGGHAGKVDPRSLVPLDCSGAVSYATGINPRVASQFKSWGKPGEGGDITVYARDTHVLAKVRGRDGKWHFFGTSMANPGGGAGWIPADKMSPEYLKGFTVRHSDR